MGIEVDKREGQSLSRRNFIRQSGVFVAGAAVGVAALSGVSSFAQDAKSSEQTIQWPWPYKRLDVERVRKLGHLGYYMGNCSSGSFYGILRALREEIGYPYTLLPIDPPNNMLAFGGGGVSGWGSHCGGLLGASAAVNLVSKKQGAIVGELTGWYTKFAFPSDTSNKYASNHEFLHNEFPAKFKGKYKTDKVLASNVSGSPLCHVSVTEWSEASGYKAYSTERSERCARLTGDCAAKAAELLNKAAAGQSFAKFVAPAGIATCNSCHGKGGVVENAKLKMDCGQCHEPHF